MPEDEVALVEEAVAEPEVVISPEEGETPEDDGTRQNLLKDLFKGATLAELKAALEEAPTEIRDELVGEIERRGEQRVQTRQKEVDTALDARTTAFRTAQQQAEQARVTLQAKVTRAKQGDTFALSDADALANEIDAYRNGAVASIALENEALMAPIRSQFLPDPSAEEKAKLEKALYEDGRRGTFTQFPVVMELAIERAKAEARAEGIAEGKRSLEAKESLLSKAAKLTEVKKQSPGVPMNGKAASSGSVAQAAVADMKKLDVTTAEGMAEFKKREDEFKRAVLR